MTPSETHTELQTQLRLRIDNLTSMNKHLDEENRNLRRTVNELVEQLRSTQQQQHKNKEQEDNKNRQKELQREIQTERERREEKTKILREGIQGLRETNEIQRRRTEEMKWILV